MNNDGCFLCSFETNYNCNLLINPSECDICGNTVRNSPEICDDGNRLDGQGCSPDCMSVLSTWTCSGGGPASNDICLPKYGDGIKVGSEICDDSNTLSGDGCSPTGQIE